MEQIVAIRKNGVELQGVLNDVTTADHRAQITLNYNQTSLTKTADDFFDALRQIRLELETQNVMILCNGARIDAVWHEPPNEPWAYRVFEPNEAVRQAESRYF